MKKIVIVGSINNFCLETSYANAGRISNYEVFQIDPELEIKKYIKFGKFGEKLNTFLPVDSWIKKVNRDVVIRIKEIKPEYIFLMARAKILFGTLATIKIVSPKTKIIWIWPDTPLNLDQLNYNCSQLYDLTACYSSSAVPIFKSIGFNNVHWIPLAGDTQMHLIPINSEKKYINDISFVGSWRPERERALSIINREFKDLSIEIFGPYWQRDCKDKSLQKKFSGKGFFGKDLGVFFNSSRININIIDDTNYPAANMRFFEILTAGGLQMSSSCPEMEDIFHQKEHLLYFNNEKELIDNIYWILQNPSDCDKIRFSGQELIKEEHSYIIRLNKIIELLDN